MVGQCPRCAENPPWSTGVLCTCILFRRISSIYAQLCPEPIFSRVIAGGVTQITAHIRE